MKSLARVTGSLSRAEVLKAIGKRQRAINRCYEKALMSNPGLSGKITFSWVITAKGKVSNARQKTSTMQGGGGVSTCVLGILRRMSFPAPEGGSVTVVFPFIFRSAS